MSRKDGVRCMSLEQVSLFNSDMVVQCDYFMGQDILKSQQPLQVISQTSTCSTGYQRWAHGQKSLGGAL